MDDLSLLALGIATPRGKPVREGYLDKRGSNLLKVWKKRYFAIYNYDNGSEPSLYWFFSQLVK
jgi:hypothetical protein